MYAWRIESKVEVPNEEDELDSSACDPEDDFRFRSISVPWSPPLSLSDCIPICSARVDDVLLIGRVDPGVVLKAPPAFFLCTGVAVLDARGLRLMEPYVVARGILLAGWDESPLGPRLIAAPPSDPTSASIVCFVTALRDGEDASISGRTGA